MGEFPRADIYRVPRHQPSISSGFLHIEPIQSLTNFRTRFQYALVFEMNLCTEASSDAPNLCSSEFGFRCFEEIFNCLKKSRVILVQKGKEKLWTQKIFWMNHQVACGGRSPRNFRTLYRQRRSLSLSLSRSIYIYIYGFYHQLPQPFPRLRDLPQPSKTMRSTPTFQKVSEIYPQLLTWQNLSPMCIDVESTAEADGDGSHLAATCCRWGRRESSKRERRRGSTLQLPLRRCFWRGQIAGGGFDVAQIAGGGEAGERGRARERERRAGERKTFLLPPLLATEAISVARRREEREERGREGGEIFLLLPVKRAYARRRELEREGGGRERESGREEDFPPPASSPGAPQLVRPRRQHREHHPQLVLR